MIAVIQSATGRQPHAGHMKTRDGRRVLFVADPEQAPGEPGLCHARPDSRSNFCGLPANSDEDLYFFGGAEYLWLIQSLHDADVTDDPEFQQRFDAYHRVAQRTQETVLLPLRDRSAPRLRVQRD